MAKTILFSFSEINKLIQLIFYIDNMSKKGKIIRLCFLSDRLEIGDDFVKNIFEESVLLTDEKTGYQILEKKVDDENYKFQIGKFAEQGEKVEEFISSNAVVFIFLEMTERESFENLVDKWLIWLRDICNFQDMVIIFGEYDISRESKSFMVDKEEINSMIEMSKMRAKFIEIGGLDKEEVIKIVDNVIKEAVEMYKNNKKLDEFEGGSTRKCVIF